MSVRRRSAPPHVCCHPPSAEEATEVIGVARDDYVSVMDEQRNMSVDDIGCPCRSADLPGRPRHPVIQAKLDDTLKKAGKERLA